MNKALKILKQDELNRYKILKHISARSRCDFFKVVEKETDKLYTFKILRPVNDNDQEDDLYSNNIKKFMEEAEIWSIINSPLIVKMIGLCFNYRINNNSTAIMILEYCLNSSLEKLIERIKSGQKIREWNDTRKLICIYGIAAGMQYLHSKQIVHLDLRPANILLNESLIPKINDFYTSVKIGPNNESSLQKNAETICYMAPEVVNDDYYSTAADVYSFGVTVHEILICKKPFEGSINNRNVKISDQIPKSYQNLISKCLVSDHSYRPTFADIVKYLRNNKKFITESVNEEEFINFCEFVDSAHQVQIELEKKVEINSKPIELIKKKPCANLYRAAELKTGNEYAEKINVADQFEKVHTLIRLNNSDKNIEKLNVDLPTSETNQQNQEEQKVIAENEEEQNNISICEEECENEEDQQNEEPKQIVIPENVEYQKHEEPKQIVIPENEEEKEPENEEEEEFSLREENESEKEEDQNKNFENNEESKQIKKYELVVKQECSEEADESEQRSDLEESSNSGEERIESSQAQKSDKPKKTGIKKTRKLIRRRRIKNKNVIKIKVEPDEPEIPTNKEKIEKEKIEKEKIEKEKIEKEKIEKEKIEKETIEKEAAKPIQANESAQVSKEPSSPPKIVKNSPPLKPFISHYDRSVFYQQQSSPSLQAKNANRRSPGPIKLKVTLKDIGLEGLDSPDLNHTLELQRKRKIEQEKSKLNEKNQQNSQDSNKNNPKPISILSSAHRARRSQKIIPTTNSRRNKY